MFYRCFPYKHAITETLNNSTEGIHLLISEEEWDQFEMLKSFLGVFFTTTVKLSYSYTSSTHELLHQLYRISKMNYLFLIWFILNFIFINFHFFFSLLFLSYFFYLIFFYILFFYLIFFLYSFSQKVYHEIKNIESLESSLSPIVEAMKEKFLKFWEEVHVVIIIVNCLHPSFKGTNKIYIYTLMRKKIA
jgi:hypothetical protein